MSDIVKTAASSAAAAGLVIATPGAAQTSRPGPQVVKIENEPPPRIFAVQPVPSQLAQGRVVIDYWMENLRIQPVFGEAALQVSPRVGHIHVTVDDTPWHWADASGEPIIITPMPPGPHRVLIELVNPAHRPIDQVVVSFVVPERAPQ
jgi:hypothetical protein